MLFAQEHGTRTLQKARAGNRFFFGSNAIRERVKKEQELRISVKKGRFTVSPLHCTPHWATLTTYYIKQSQRNTANSEKCWY